MKGKRWTIRVLEEGRAVCQSGPMTHPDSVEVMPVSEHQDQVRELEAEREKARAVLKRLGELRDWCQRTAVSEKQNPAGPSLKELGRSEAYKVVAGCSAWNGLAALDKAFTEEGK